MCQIFSFLAFTLERERQNMEKGQREEWTEDLKLTPG